MKTIDELPDDFECNIDTCNEEIVRLTKRLGQTPPDFIPGIFKANEKIAELKAELAKKADVVVRPEPKLNVAPQITDPPKVKTSPTAAEQSEPFGLQRCVLANAETQKSGKQQREAKSTYKPTGLWAAMLANVELQKTKPKN
jgi:hypothetical protein